MAPFMQALLQADQRAASWFSQPVAGLGKRSRFALRFLTHLGDGHVWALLAGVLCLGWGRLGLQATEAGAVACLGSLALFKIIKNGVARPRPDSSLQSASRLLVPLDQYSFPSGHSATSLSVALTLGHFFPALLAPLLGLSLAISLSRVALKVHYPLDILAGWALGACNAGLALLFLGRVLP
jgi:undecaprenyl-diphosphatase